MARAISTHSSASPEVERMTTLPSSSRTGTGSLEEEIALQRFERRGGLGGIRREAQFQREARRVQHGGEQFALQAAARGEIERHHGGLAQAVVSGGKGVAGEVDARGVVGQAALGKLAGVGREQACEVGARFAAGAQTLGLHGVEAQFFEGRGQSAREAGKTGHRLQVGELAAPERFGGDARGQRFAHEPAHRHQAAAIQLRGGEFQHELAQRQAAHAERASAHASRATSSAAARTGASTSTAPHSTHSATNSAARARNSA